MKLEFALAGSPNDAFCSQIAMFRKALDWLGEPYRSARLIAMFGDWEIGQIPDRWTDAFRNIDIVWVDPSDYADRSYVAQGVRRFSAFSPDTDIAFVCDADTLPVARFDGLLEAAMARPAFRAVMGMRPPMIGERPINWAEVSAQLGISQPEHRFAYSRSTRPDGAPFGLAPLYPNAGFLVATPAIFETLENELEDLRRRFMQAYTDDGSAAFYSAQICLGLAVHTTGVDHDAIPLRYNFPNLTDQSAFPEELTEIAICHYQVQEIINRWKIFENRADFDAFMALDLTGANRALQTAIRGMTKAEYPFADSARDHTHTLPYRVMPRSDAAALSDADRFKFYLDWSAAMLRQKNPAGAIDMALQARSIDKADPRPAALKAEALLALGRRREAVATLRKALRTTPDSSLLYEGLGLACKSAGRIRAARTCLERATVLETASANAFAELAILLGEAGEVSPALEAMRQAIALQPGSFRNQMQLGNLLMQDDAFSKAETAYTQAESLRPGNAGAWFKLSQARMRRGDLKSALEAAEYATVAAPDQARFAKHVEALKSRLALETE